MSDQPLSKSILCAVQCVHGLLRQQNMKYVHLMAMFMILDRIAFCILLSKSTALSNPMKESEEDPTVPKAPKDNLINFI